MTAYYNEIEPFAAEWMRNLACANHIATGTVDTRSIADVRAEDLTNFAQCHFFAGLGGWSYALRLAGWPDDAPVWTGSCPCQPFSSAGERKGFADERHLWPTWFGLIRERRPSIIFGEQVASRDGLAWLDLVSADLENAGYAVGAADLCAASVGAPHIRQRLYFVAVALGDGNNPRLERRRVQFGSKSGERKTRKTMSFDHVAHPRSLAATQEHRTNHCTPSGTSNEVQNKWVWFQPCASSSGVDWNTAEWIECTDGKSRPVEPGTFPLAHGVPARVGRLRGYGNAIVPQVAATFIHAVMQTITLG